LSAFLIRPFVEDEAGTPPSQVFSLGSAPQPSDEALAPRCSSILDGCEPDIMLQGFQNAHTALREHALIKGLKPEELGCTALGLLLNVATGCGICGQIGDGAVLGLTANGRLSEIVEAPDPGDPQSVYTIGHPSFQEFLAIGSVADSPDDPYVAYYVMTDGLSGDILYSPDLAAVDRWGQAINHNVRIESSPADAASQMLNWLATYRVKGSWDDRTLVIISRKDG
jgi:hypothetical protein